jgi:hypothetical protein
MKSILIYLRIIWMQKAQNIEQTSTSSSYNS